MDSCRETAFCLTLWYAVLTAIVTALGIALHDLALPVALLAAANVALLFALVLMARAGRLTDINITRGQFWRTVPPRDRPRGESGARAAHEVLRQTWLTFAKRATALALLLASLAYMTNGVTPQMWSAALRAPAAYAATNAN